MNCLKVSVVVIAILVVLHVLGERQVALLYKIWYEIVSRTIKLVELNLHVTVLDIANRRVSIRTLMRELSGLTLVIDSWRQLWMLVLCSILPFIKQKSPKIHS